MDKVIQILKNNFYSELVLKIVFPNKSESSPNNIVQLSIFSILFEQITNSE